MQGLVCHSRNLLLEISSVIICLFWYAYLLLLYFLPSRVFLSEVHIQFKVYCLHYMFLKPGCTLYISFLQNLLRESIVLMGVSPNIIMLWISLRNKVRVWGFYWKPLHCSGQTDHLSRLTSLFCALAEEVEPHSRC